MNLAWLGVHHWPSAHGQRLMNLCHFKWDQKPVFLWSLLMFKYEPEFKYLKKGNHHRGQRWWWQLVPPQGPHCTASLLLGVVHDSVCNVFGPSDLYYFTKHIVHMMSYFCPYFGVLTYILSLLILRGGDWWHFHQKLPLLYYLRNLLFHKFPVSLMPAGQLSYFCFGRNRGVRRPARRRPAQNAETPIATASLLKRRALYMHRPPAPGLSAPTCCLQARLRTPPACGPCCFRRLWPRPSQTRFSKNNSGICLWALYIGHYA